MENFLGWVSLFIMFFCIFIWTKKHPETTYFLFVAFLLRAICIILDNHDVMTLPDGTADATTFDRKAREYSDNYGLSILLHPQFIYYDSLMAVKIISIFYSLFGESKMLAQSISVGLGTISVYLVYVLTSMIWDNKSAKKAAWVAALFPSLVLYSSLPLREVYIVFFLLIALIGVANYFRDQKTIYLLHALIGFSVLILFHGAASIGAFVFLAYLFLKLMLEQLTKLYNLKINVFSIILIIFLSIPIILFLQNKLRIPYIPDLYDLDSIITITNLSMIALDAGSEYPSWLLINNTDELIPKTIMRAIYFLYSPFIWDIKKAYHIIGFFDSILYFILTFYLIKNIKAIWANPVSRVFLLMFIVYVIIHGLGVGNFGTAIRHKSKFVVILIILAAPKIHKFILSTKKKTYMK